jgi:uncharacterized protein (TIGR00725 family)
MAITSKVIIGIMGPAIAPKEVLEAAYQLGELSANEGYIVLTGGANAGVMDAALKGAKNVGGLTVGILKDGHVDNMSQYADIPIVTGLGSARNNINVLTSTVIVACGNGAGTASEIALALKANKNVILLKSTEAAAHFFKGLAADRVYIANEPIEAIETIKQLLKDHAKLS